MLLVREGVVAHCFVAVVVEVEGFAQEVLDKSARSGRWGKNRGLDDGFGDVGGAYKAVEVVHPLDVDEEAGAVALVALDEGCVEAAGQAVCYRDYACSIWKLSAFFVGNVRGKGI